MHGASVSDLYVQKADHPGQTGLYHKAGILKSLLISKKVTGPSAPFAKRFQNAAGTAASAAIPA